MRDSRRVGVSFDLCHDLRRSLRITTALRLCSLVAHGV